MVERPHIHSEKPNDHLSPHNTRFNYRIAFVTLHEGNVLPRGQAELLKPFHQTLKREMRKELDTEIHIESLLWCHGHCGRPGGWPGASS